MGDIVKDGAALIAAAKNIKTAPLGLLAPLAHVLLDLDEILTGTHTVGSGATPAPTSGHALVEQVEATDPLTDEQVQAAEAEAPVVGGPISDVMLAVQILATMRKYAPEVWGLIKGILHK